MHWIAVDQEKRATRKLSGAGKKQNKTKKHDNQNKPNCWLKINPNVPRRVFICIFYEKDSILLYRDLCSVARFARKQKVTRKGKDLCGVMSSVWSSRPESHRIQMTTRHARRVSVTNLCFSSERELSFLSCWNRVEQIPYWFEKT